MIETLFPRFHLPLYNGMEEAREETDKQDVENQMFLPLWCRVECTKGAGRVSYRQLNTPGIPDVPVNREPPSTDLGARSDMGDPESPLVKEYTGCAIKDTDYWM